MCVCFCIVCVQAHSLLLAAFWLRCTRETLRQQLSVLLHCLLLQLALFLSSQGAPRGEIWREVQQEDARQLRVKASREKKAVRVGDREMAREYFVNLKESAVHSVSSALHLSTSFSLGTFSGHDRWIFLLRVLYFERAGLRIFLSPLRNLTASSRSPALSTHATVNPPPTRRQLTLGARHHSRSQIPSIQIPLCPPSLSVSPSRALFSPCFPLPLFLSPWLCSHSVITQHPYTHVHGKKKNPGKSVHTLMIPGLSVHFWARQQQFWLSLSQ